MQDNALWLTYLMVPPSRAEMAQAEADAAHWLQKLPAWMLPSDKTRVLSMNRAYSQPRVTCSWPVACAGGSPGYGAVPGVVVLDDLAELAEETRHLQWRQWLVLFNALQVLPGMRMTSMSGIDGGDCDGMAPPVDASGVGAVSADQAAWSAGWVEAVGLARDFVVSGMKRLAQQGLPSPVVGHELADLRGDVVAEAELAWPDNQLVVLTAEQADMANMWSEAGWRVVVLDSAGEAVAGGGDWFVAVVQAMSKSSAAGEAAFP